MFRDLIPRLANKYHVIAPDHLGFGYSAIPPADSFEYSFAALASLTIAFTEKLGLTSYAIFVQDYGAPIGWRMALEHPERITAIITQNGNAYEDGIVDKVWAAVVAYDAAPLLATWGENDEIFPPAGATAFQRDLPDAEIRFLPTGHFALETHAAEIAVLVDDFLERALAR
jgi:pimeloyl-ACP methyl ester carboxylesterase